MTPPVPPAALSERDAATYCACSGSYLRKCRGKGEGPAFIRFGARGVRYLVADLNAWLGQHRVRRGEDRL